PFPTPPLTFYHHSSFTHPATTEIYTLSLHDALPISQNFVDRAVRGDYFNLHVDLDLTIPRLKRGLMLGTHWGQLDMQVEVVTSEDRKSTRLNSSHVAISYAVFCLKKKKSEPTPK